MKFFWKIIQWMLDRMKIIGATCLVVLTLIILKDVIVNIGKLKNQ